MARKRYSPEIIIRKLREAEVLQGQGKTIAEVVKQILREVVEGKIPSPAVRRHAVRHVRGRLGHSQRRVCRASGVARSSIR